MIRQEFSARLRQRLYGLPQSEIEKAVSYYDEMIQDRVEDGMTEEEAVAALGDFEEIVNQELYDQSIPTLLKANFTNRQSHPATPQGSSQGPSQIPYQAAGVSGPGNPQASAPTDSRRPNAYGPQNNSAYGQMPPYPTPPPAQSKNNVAWILLVVFTAPLWIPLGITVFALIFSVFMIIFCLFFAFAAILFGLALSGIACIPAAVYLFVTATAAEGLVTLGLGFMAFGLFLSLWRPLLSAGKGLINLMVNGARKIKKPLVNKFGGAK